MKKRCNRAILFVKIDDTKEDLLSLISLTDLTLALSDEEIKRIDEACVVHSLAEFEHKFGVYHMAIENDVEDEKEPLERVAEYYHIVKEKKKEYQCWYYDVPKNAKNAQEKRERAIKQYEVWLGIKSFFEQGEDVELLISNLSDQDLASEKARRKLSIYLETVNGKLENQQRIGLAIFPEIPMLSESHQIERMRFEGHSQNQITQAELLMQIGKVFQILQMQSVMMCYQFTTGEASSAKMFAAKGNGKIRENAIEIQRQTGCDCISCCYPNLTWIEDSVYIGAAYVVAGMLLTGMSELSTTTIPRELYPYHDAVKEEIYTKPFGSMLANSMQEQGKYMMLFCARSQKWNGREYVRIDEVSGDV